jgi:hypothetical protein
MTYGFLDRKSRSMISAAKKLPSQDRAQPEIRIPTNHKDAFAGKPFRIDPFRGDPMHRIFAIHAEPRR